MDPLDFHKLASKLVIQGGTAEFRTAISRAYYSTFLLCCKRINDLGFNLPRDARSHEEVKCYLNNCDDFKLSQVAFQLLDLRHKRNWADYDLNCKQVENKKNATGALKQAERMISTINNRFNEKSSEITDKINEYRKNVKGLSY